MHILSKRWLPLVIATTAALALWALAAAHSYAWQAIWLPAAVAAAAWPRARARSRRHLADGASCPCSTDWGSSSSKRSARLTQPAATEPEADDAPGLVLLASSR
jgi:hypothetical protein